MIGMVTLQRISCPETSVANTSMVGMLILLEPTNLGTITHALCRPPCRRKGLIANNTGFSSIHTQIAMDWDTCIFHAIVQCMASWPLPSRALPSIASNCAVAQVPNSLNLSNNVSEMKKLPIVITHRTRCNPLESWKTTCRSHLSLTLPIFHTKDPLCIASNVAQPALSLQCLLGLCFTFKKVFKQSPQSLKIFHSI